MDFDEKKNEAVKRLHIKLEFTFYLAAIAFTLFTFIISLNQDLVKENVFLALQLSLSIPLYFSSIFARAKISTKTHKPIWWERFGFFTFILAYGFTINVVGILLTELVSPNVGLYFWVTNILSAVAYSVLEICAKESSLTSRLRKDFLFVSVIILLGVLPAFGMY